jgi:hypothetical protein
MLPRVVRDSRDRTVAVALPAQLGHSGFADGNCTCRAQALHVDVIELRHAIAEQIRPAHGAHTSSEGQILDGGRHAVQQTESLTSDNRGLGWRAASSAAS